MLLLCTHPVCSPSPRIPQLCSRRALVGQCQPHLSRGLEQSLPLRQQHGCLAAGWENGKWQPPGEAGLPGEHPNAIPSQQPKAAQRMLTPGVLTAEPQLPRWSTETWRGGGGETL